MTVAVEDQPVQPENGAMRAYRLLGGEEIMKTSVRNTLDIHDLIVQGVPSNSLLYLAERVGILSTGDVLNKATGVRIRTLQGRKADGRKVALSAEQGSRAWRFAEVFTRTMDVLGSQDAAEAWLLEPAIGLENRSPIDLLTSAAGAKAVADYLTRLEYGVYS